MLAVMLLRVVAAPARAGFRALVVIACTAFGMLFSAA
jgi:hypothetical protein